jgi:EAL domain-containing protein (putative c-di-GMP-specific phosphodiesterase class I)
VETAQIADMLQAMGCEQAQGYHFARPQTADQLQDFLRQQAASQPGGK